MTTSRAHTSPITRIERRPERRTMLSRALIITLVALITLAPTFLALAVTGPAQPAGLMTHPWRGWQLLATVVRDAPSSPTASPGSALAAARAEFEGSDLRPRRAELVYLASTDRFTAERFDTNTTDDPSRSAIDIDAPLVWVITGTRRNSRATGVVGVINYASGDVMYDARTPQRRQENNER